MTEYALIAIVFLWWAFAVYVFSAAIHNTDETAWAAVSVAVFWPVIAPIGICIVLWRGMFRSVRQMQMDIRNRGQWKEFQRWVAEKAAEEGKVK